MRTELVKSPAEYQFPLAEWIAFEHARGDSLAKLHEHHPEKVPSPIVIKRWRRDYPAFDLLMNEAEQARAAALADETLIFADNPELHAGQAGNSIKARQWLAARLDRDRWGQHVTTAHTGTMSADHGAMAEYSDADLQAIIAAGLRAGSLEGEAERIETADPTAPPGNIKTGPKQKHGGDLSRPKIFAVNSSADIVTTNITETTVVDDGDLF